MDNEEYLIQEPRPIRAEDVRGLSGFVDFKLRDNRDRLNKLVAYVAQHLKDNKSHVTDKHIIDIIAGILPKVSHNKLVDYRVDEHSKRDDSAISKKRVWSSAKITQEITKREKRLQKELKSLSNGTNIELEGIKNQLKILKEISNTLAKGETLEGLARLVGEKVKLLKESLLTKSDQNHKHPEYVKEKDVDTKLRAKANKTHGHDEYSKKGHLHSEYAKKQHEHGEYIDRLELDNLATKLDVAMVKGVADSKAPLLHDHDYATKKDIDKAIAKLPEPLTPENIDSKLEELAPLQHKHRIRDVAGLQDALDNAGGDALPDQTGNDGKFLTTDGSVPSWADVNATIEPESGSVTRDVNGYVDEVTKGTTVFTITRTDGYIDSVACTDYTVSFTRDGNNLITSWTVT